MAAERRVVVLAFDGVQSLDVTGPVEVFDVAARHGITPSYRVEVVGPDRRAGHHHQRDLDQPGPGARRRSRPGRHVHRGRGRRRPRADRRRRARRRRAPGRPPRPARRLGLQRRVPPRGGGPAGRPPGHDALGPLPPARPRVPERHRGSRPDLRARRRRLHVRRSHRGHRSLPRARRSRPRTRPRAVGRPPARRVPEAARRAGAVQQPPLDPGRRARRARGGPGLDRRSPRRGPDRRPTRANAPR